MIEENYEDLKRHLDLLKQQRAEQMPTVKDALETIFLGYLRLKDMGWNFPMHCPKDGSEFFVVEAGSTGVFPCVYVGKWPDGEYVIRDGDESYSVTPMLFNKEYTELTKPPAEEK